MITESNSIVGHADARLGLDHINQLGGCNAYAAFITYNYPLGMFYQTFYRPLNESDCVYVERPYGRGFSCAPGHWPSTPTKNRLRF